MIDRKILPLTLGGLAIGTTEFAIMGLLPDVANAMHITISSAGHLISAYALGVVVGAPTLIRFASGYPPKKVLIAIMLAFTLFNSLSAIATNPGFLIFTRFLSGLPHGAFFGVGGVVAARLAKKGKEASYISMMYTGLTVANLAMVPLVTFIGHALSWRWYFAIVGVIGALTVFTLKAFLPNLEGNEKTNLKTELNFLKRQQSWYVLGIVGIGFGGVFAWLSYINPLMTNIAGFSSQNMPYIMILAGAGMVAGNIAGAKLSEAVGPAKAVATLVTALIVTLLAVFFFSGNQYAALVLTFICGALSMSLIAPVNIIMMQAASDSQMMGAAFVQAAFNIANSIGAFVGGLPMVFGYPVTYPALLGAGLTLIGLFIAIAQLKKYPDQANIKTAGQCLAH